MAVTDLTQSMPWWLMQGTGPNGEAPGGGVLGYPASSGAGPNMGYPAQGGGGPTGGTEGTPQGAAQGWLQYLAQMAGLGPAQAGGLPPRLASSLQTSPASPFAPPQPGYNPLAGGSANTGMPVAPAANPLAAASGSPPVGAGMLDQSGVARNQAGVLQPGLNPNAPSGNATPMAGVGGATGMTSSSNPRFVSIDRPNAPAGGGGGMARGGPPQMTALNLASLFNRGQNPPTAANVPAANAQPVSAFRGPLATPGGMQMSPSAVANAVSKPNWWQGLGRPDMTPDQLAQAVRRPNWYRSM
jgi:hypothetical protein